MRALHSYLLAGLALLLVITTAGCPAAPSENVAPTAATTVTVAITRDFGREVILEKQVEIQDGASAMDALQKVATVETEYGGGFVQSINGLRSTYGGASRSDWFYSVNGINARSGAMDYQLRAGDMLHFDFHDWAYTIFIPAIAGAYPEPFLSGYNGVSYPTVIVYDAPFKQEAESLQSKLAALGVKNVSAAPLSSLSQAQKETSNIILIGLSDNALISELNQVYKKLGFFAYFQDGKIEMLDTRGKPQEEYGTGSGLILATQSPWNPSGLGAAQNSVWIVSGTDEAGVKRAAGILIDKPEEVRYAFSAVVADSGVLKAPR